MEWWSIEVFHGGSSAARWKDAYGASLVEAALTNGAVDWAWHEHRWGVVLEVAFLDEWRWEFFYELPAVQAALDAAPDPDPIQEDDFEPYWIEPGFDDDIPEPVPDPSPLNEPAAICPPAMALPGCSPPAPDETGRW